MTPRYLYSFTMDRVASQHRIKMSAGHCWCLGGRSIAFVMFTLMQRPLSASQVPRRVVASDRQAARVVGVFLSPFAWLWHFKIHAHDLDSLFTLFFSYFYSSNLIFLCLFELFSNKAMLAVTLSTAVYQYVVCKEYGLDGLCCGENLRYLSCIQ